MNLADFADEELVAKVQEQGAESAAAFQELLARCNPLLLSYFRRARHPTEDASDLCQEVWTRVWKWLSDPDVSRRFDPALGSFRHYLLRVARNVATDCFRRRQRQLRGSSPESEAEPPQGVIDRLGSPVRDVDMDDLIEVVIRDLDENERTVLSYLRKGASVSQICAASGLSQPTVWRIRRRLEQAFKDILDA
jgi:RNA polymerase sigma factor (sigma-70 family)